MRIEALAPVVAIIAAGLAVLALAFLYVTARRLRRLQKAQRVVLGSRGDVDVVAYVAALEEKVSNLRLAVEDLSVEARDHEVRIDGCLSRVGMVRFDAYHDLGGRQSTSVAFMDAGDNGIVITTVVSRDFARMYVKTIKDGQHGHRARARRDRGGRPGALDGPLHHPSRARMRPRRTRRRHRNPRRIADLEDSEAAARALERENRRRERQGLPPLDELPPAPSTLGWPKLEPLPAIEPAETDDHPGAAESGGHADPRTHRGHHVSDPYCGVKGCPLPEWDTSDPRRTPGARRAQDRLPGTPGHLHRRGPAGRAGHVAGRRRDRWRGA